MSRRIQDGSGRWWTVRDVTPQRAERRLSQRRMVPDRRGGFRQASKRRLVMERRLLRQLRAHIGSQFAQGWLTFESDDGRLYRFAPVPPNWSGFSDAELLRLLWLQDRLHD